MTNNRRSMPDEVIGCAIEYIHHERDRAAVSRVCKRWYEIESATRRDVTVAFCYATTPHSLLQRFPNIESLRLKGKPRAAMFKLIPNDWGGFAAPWLDHLHSFPKLMSLHFRRMIVTDDDLNRISTTKGRILQSLKLDKCSGFSTDGLSVIARSCRALKTLFLQESEIINNSGEWIHELAVNNRVLETLNFHLTYLDNVDHEDLAIIAKNCPLVSLKASLGELPHLADILGSAKKLEEFSGVFVVTTEEASITFPPRLRHLGPNYTAANNLPLVYQIAHSLTSLNLMLTLLTEEGVISLIRRCPNLEVLEIMADVIGDDGLEALSMSCRRLKRFRIEQLAEGGVHEEQVSVTSRGLIAISNGCPELEYVAVYVTEISNNALASIGANLRQLQHFRLVLLESGNVIADHNLDDGVRALLVGCQMLRGFALYLRPGAGLTDQGLQFIGQYSQNVTWMLLGHVGETDDGLRAFSRGCPNLRKLEMRGCVFSWQALAEAATELKRKSLRYLWFQGYQATLVGFNELQAMVCPFWHIEVIPPRVVVSDHGVAREPAHVIGYYSLAPRRNDFPADFSVIPLP